MSTTDSICKEQKGEGYKGWIKLSKVIRTVPREIKTQERSRDKLLKVREGVERRMWN